MKNVTLARWKQLDNLVEEALAHPPDERSAILRATCGHDLDLYRESVALLERLEEAEQALGESVAEYAAPLWDSEEDKGDQSYEPGLVAGTEVGAYRVLRELGRGGMGAVYLVERADGTYEKEVALKLVKRGMDTDEVVRRFRRERRIHAGLDHPGIARLLDAGAAPDGRPFLVMEYVEGEPITTYADRLRLDVEARLALFEQVCEAVRYAHRRLVIHRDLKPSNILVTEDEDGASQVKLLDFGIARLLDPELDETVTGTGSRPLTPAYAAPEQLRGESITTATDVYALGIVLYELLAGQRPPLPLKPPSVVVESLPQTRSAGERVRRRLRGDLDVLVLKALREDAAARYPSVEALLDDLRRYQTGLPLHARAASVGYRVRKFVQRHRVGVGAAVLVLAVLVLGLGMTAWQAQEKAREAARADRARDFALSLFSLADPDEARGQAITTEDLLDRGAERALSELSEEPEVQEQILLALAGINHRLSRDDEARGQYAYVRAQREARLGSEDPGVAEALAGLATLAMDEGDFVGADSLYSVALTIQRQHDDPLALAATLHSYGVLARWENDLDAAEARHREALALRQRHAGPESPDVAESLKSLALVQHQRDAYDEAEALYREALALQVAVSGEFHPGVGSICNSLASLLRNQGRYAEADSLYRRALAVYRRVYPGDNEAVVTALAQWSSLLMDRGRPEAAQAPADEAVAMARRLFGDSHPSVALAGNSLALALVEQERYTEAIVLQEEIVALYEGGLGPDHLYTTFALVNLAWFHLEKGDVATAEPLFQRVQAIQDAALEPGHSERARALLGLGRVALAQGRAAEAEPLFRQALSIREGRLGADLPDTAQAQSWLGACLTALGRLQEAGPLLEASARYQEGEARRSIQRTIRANLAAYRAAGGA